MIRTPCILSPYLLIQEFLRDNPWRLLVACIMLNQTTAKQVHRIINQFFDRYPDPVSFIGADIREVKPLIRCLGFQNRRYERLRRMSCDFIAWDRHNVLDLHGVGRYAADSYRIFCEGYLVLEPQDKELRNYVQWAKEQSRGEPADHTRP